MDQFIHFLQQAWAWVMASGPSALAALMSVLSGLIALFLLVPGEQPEKFLQVCLDWLTNFSRKPPTDGSK